MNRKNIKNTIYSLYTLVLNIVIIVHTYLVGTIEGSLMAYHTRALCNEKEPKIPGADGDRQARSHYHKG